MLVFYRDIWVYATRTNVYITFVLMWICICIRYFDAISTQIRNIYNLEQTSTKFHEISFEY